MTGVEDILGPGLAQWIDTYGHLVLVVIMLFEGTVTSFVAGALSAVGVFNPFLVIVAYLVARLSVDTVLLFLSRHASGYLEKFPAMRRIIQKVRVDSSEQGELSKFLDENFLVCLFLAQILPVALIHSVLIVAVGTMRMSLKRIYLYLLVGQPILSAAVVSFGYFFGDALQNPHETINIISLALSAVVIGVILYWKFGHNWLLEQTKLKLLFKNGWRSGE